MSGKTLQRARNDRLIAGVMGGIARYYGLSPNALRLAYVLLSVVSAGFPGILVYLVLWLVLPLED